VSSGQSDLIKGPTTELNVSVAGSRRAHCAVIIIRTVVVIGERVVVIGERIVVIGERVVVVRTSWAAARTEGKRKTQEERAGKATAPDRGQEITLALSVSSRLEHPRRLLNTALLVEGSR
jgi:hypothetical protein